MGRRHDLQHWDADSERFPAALGTTKLYAPKATTDGIHAWISAAFEPVRQRYFADLSGRWTYAGAPNEVFAVLQAKSSADVPKAASNDADADNAFQNSFDESDKLEAISDGGENVDEVTNAPLSASTDGLDAIEAKAKAVAERAARRETIRQLKQKPSLDLRERAVLAAAEAAEREDETAVTAEGQSSDSTVDSKAGRPWNYVRSKKDQEAVPHAIESVVHTLKEVVVIRSPPSVHVFNVVEHGRRFYRTLVFASDASRCMHSDGGLALEAAPRTESDAKAGACPSLSVGDAARPAPPQPSLVVSRHLHADLGEQAYIPKRFLFGLLPGALLDQYVFWQNANNDLVGYPASDTLGEEDSISAPRPRAEPASVLRVRLVNIGAPDLTGMGQASAVAIAVRVPLKTVHAGQMPTLVATGFDYSRRASDTLLSAGSAEEALGLAAVDVTVAPMTLLNAIHAPPNSPLHTIAHVFGCLDDLSHVLFWSYGARIGPGDVANPSLVELPRVGVKFAIAPNGDLNSVDHPGFKVYRGTDDAVSELIRGCPHALVLEGRDESLVAMVPATAKPLCADEVRAGHTSKKSAPVTSRGMLLDRRDTEWLGNLSSLDARHYLYPIHSSHACLAAPSVASALHLLVVRLLSRRYADAFRLCTSCVTDAPLSPDELQLWQRLRPLSYDEAPDAIATRLRLALVTAAVANVMMPAWDVTRDARLYFLSRDRVSMPCRLTPRDELEAIESLSGIARGVVDVSDEAGWLLLNRRDLLRLALRADAPREPKLGVMGASVWRVSLRYPQHRPEGPSSDASARVVGLDAKSFMANFATLSYSRPEEAKDCL